MSALTKTFALVFACIFSVALSSSWAAEKNTDPQSVRNGIRLKLLTRELQLTEDQQQKVKVVLNEESGAITKIQEDSKLSVSDRSAKVKEVQTATYAKIKPLLTEAQQEKFAKIQASPDKSKKARTN